MLHQVFKPTDMQQLHITIPEPCQENWQIMTPTEQGRFCNACAKEVIDFSMMTDAEVLGFFFNVKNEKVCGRAIPSQLERTIAMPKEPVKRKFWYWNYITMVFLLFGKTSKVAAQTKDKVIAIPANPQHCPVKMGKMILPTKSIAAIQKNILIRGNIMDNKGEAIPFASVKIKNTNQGVSADTFGNFSLKIHQGNIIEISALGYITKEIVADATDNELNIILLAEVKLLNEVIITSFTDYTTKGLVRYTTGTMSVSRKTTIADTIRTFFNKPANLVAKIYPNPVPVGNTIKLSAKLKAEGQYFIEITDAAGKMVLQQKINAASKQLDQIVQTDPRWSKGMYFLKLTNNKNEKVFADSFIVQ